MEEMKEISVKDNRLKEVSIKENSLNKDYVKDNSIKEHRIMKNTMENSNMENEAGGDNPDRCSYEQLEELIKRLVPEHKTQRDEWFCPNHILEIYLYEYWVNHGEYKCTSSRINTLYRQKGILEEKSGRLEEAEKSFLSALEWNPVDMESYIALCENNAKRKEWYALKENAQKMYLYCYTRADMARYYRYLGRHFLEVYQPELAACLYHYSNYWYRTRTADKELEFLKAAAGNRIESLSFEKDRRLLSEHKIPLQPEAMTLSILYYAAKKEKDSEMQKLYYYMLYQVTGNSEIGKP